MLIVLYNVTLWSILLLNILLNLWWLFCYNCIWLYLKFWNLLLFYFTFFLLWFFIFFFTWICDFYFSFVKEIDNFLFAFLASCELVPDIVGFLNEVFINFVLFFLKQWWVDKFIIIPWSSSYLKLFKIKPFLQSFFFQLSFLISIRFYFLPG